MRYLVLLVILAVAFFPDTNFAEWSLPILGGYMIVLSLYFYWLMVGLLVGLKVSALDTNIDVKTSIMSRAIYASAAALLFLNGWATAAALVAPWIAINVIVDSIAMLVKMEVLDITENDE